MNLIRHAFKALGVASFGVDFQQLLLDCHARGVDFGGFLENFFRLHVPPIGQVDIGLGYRINIVCGVQLAWGIDHRRAGLHAVVGVNPLAATGAKKRIWLQPALKKRAVLLQSFLLLARPVEGQPAEQGDQADCRSGNQRVFQQLVNKRGLRCGLRRWRNRGAGGAGGNCGGR